ncbi:IS66 family transposase, partial [Geobacillus thermoleovorans]
LVVYLYNIQMIPYQRLRDMMEELYQVHVACTSAYTYLAPHASCGKKATDEIGILPQYKGTMMHDAFGT